MNQSEAIGCIIKRLSNEIGRCLSGGETDGVTRMQRWIIGYILNRKDADVFQKDIEENFNIRRSTATGILQLMEKNGLLVRESVSWDKRLKKLVTTDKAVKLYLETRARIDKIEEQLRKDIPHDEIDIFIKTAEKMCSNLKCL